MNSNYMNFKLNEYLYNRFIYSVIEKMFEYTIAVNDLEKDSSLSGLKDILSLGSCSKRNTGGNTKCPKKHAKDNFVM